MPRCDFCDAEFPVRALRSCAREDRPEERFLVCPDCFRSKRIRGREPCPVCDGKGHVPRRDVPAISVSCQPCDGSGTLPLVK